MEPRRKSADSFGTFLEIVQGKSDPDAAASSDDGALRVLRALDGAGPIAVSELWPKTGMQLGPFAEALKTVKENGFAASTGPPESELVEITESGAKVAAVARGGP
jgi:hypothetical protein